MARDYERPDGDKAGSGRRDSDRNASGRPSNDRGEKKIFNRRDKPERGEGGERRSFNSDRKEGGERKPYGDRREGGERRSFGGDRRDGGERKPYSDRRESSDRKTGTDRREGGRSYGNDRREVGEKRTFGGDRREGGERRSFNSDRPERREGGERRSYGSDRREDGERRSFTPRREDGERKSYGSDKREGGERKSYGSERRDGGEGRSFNSDRRESSDRKPYGDRREGGERRSYGDDKREGGERRPFSSDRPERSDRREGSTRPYNEKSFKERKEDAVRRLNGNERAEGKEKRTYGSDKKDDRRGSREGGRPSSGERRSFDGDKKPFRSDRDAKFGTGDKRGSFEGGDEPKTPNYNISRYDNNPRIKKTNIKETEDDGTIRLNRFIANAGVCSRREADTLIESGEIKVNGVPVTELGFKVQPSDTVMYGKKLLNREKLVYVLLNKPKDFLTTTEDPEGRKTVMSLVEKASTERIFPVGRLDRNTTGLLLFTNDGELAQKLTHPSNDVRKIYQVELDKPITKEDFLKVAEGVELEDGKAVVDDVALIGDTGKFLGLEIHIGRNRIVRRIFEHLGYEVVTLDRVQYAGLTKKDLPRGNWRYITEKELIRLKYFM